MTLLRKHAVKNSYSLPPEAFEWQVKQLVTSEYWIAPIQAVGKYIVERDNTVILISHQKNKMMINTTTDLNSTIYNQPLTLEVEVPWKMVSVEGSINDGILETKKHKLLIDVIPGEMTIISKLK